MEELAIRIVVLDGSQEEVIVETASRYVCIETGQSIAMTLDIGQPIFEEPGNYRVRLLANSRPLAFRDLTVCHIGRPAEI